MFSFKKGEIATSFIVSFIIMVISLVVLLVVFSQFSWGEDIDRQVCHESAVIRGTIAQSKIGGLGGVELAPLKCNTRRICVTSKLIGKGNCELEFGQDFTTVRVSGSAVEREDKIKTFLARDMADCWEMMGEGKIQLFKNGLLDYKDHSTVAVTCSRVMFDKTILEGDNKVTEIKGFSRYLLSHKVQGKEISYWDYFRGTSDGSTLQEMKGDLVDNSFSDKDKLDLTKQKAIVFVEIDKGEGLTVLGSAAGGVVGFVFCPIPGCTAAGTVLGGYLANSFKNYFGELKDEDYASSLFLTDYSAKGFEKLSIDKFENIP